MLVDDYLAQVVANIRSKEAKSFIKKELANHLEAVIKEREKKGEPNEQATKEAIEQMGNAYLLGTRLNQIHKPIFDWYLFVGFIILMILSFLPLYTIDNTNIFVNKVIYSIIGFIVCVYFIFFDYRKLAKFSYIFFIIGIGLLFFISTSSLVVNDSPYLLIAGFTINGSYTLPIFLLAWACFLQTRRKWWTFTILFLLTALLLVPISNLFLIFLYTVLVAALVLYSEQEKKEKLISVSFSISTAIIIFLYKLFTESSMIERIEGFFYPEKYANTTGYMLIKGKEYLSTAGLFGTKEAVDEGFSLPEAYTDFIFVTVIYEYGWMIGILLISILLMVAVRMISHLKVLQEPFGRLLIIGAIVLYTITFTWSILMAIGILPIVSVSLPFFSYGFLPVVLHSFLIGLVMSVYRRKNLSSLKAK